MYGEELYSHYCILTGLWDKLQTTFRPINLTGDWKTSSDVVSAEVMESLTPETKEVVQQLSIKYGTENGTIPFSNHVILHRDSIDRYSVEDFRRFFEHEGAHILQFRKGHLINTLHMLVSNQLLSVGLYEPYLFDKYEREARDAEYPSRNWIQENKTILYVQEISEKYHLQFMQRIRGKVYGRR